MQLVPLGGGFRPGTKILIKGNYEVSIEDKLEGLKPVTYVNHGYVQLGECSDEAIVSSTRSRDRLVDLWGFNNENPFFSANTVFHTPAGPCAIDPESAMQVNHWNHVLKLEAGRCVYWFDGQIYMEIRIERLICEKADCSTLHGLHLREGLRSYHANGFLVQDNHPEITSRTLARALQALPRQEQHRILSHLDVLKPLLALFSTDTRILAAALNKTPISIADDGSNISEISSTVGQWAGEVLHPIYMSQGADYQTKNEEHHGHNLWLGNYEVLPRSHRRDDDALRLGRYLVKNRSGQVRQRTRKKQSGRHGKTDQKTGKTRVFKNIQPKNTTGRGAKLSITKSRLRASRKPRSRQNNQVAIKIE